MKLNKVSVGDIDNLVESILYERLVEEDNYTKDILHIITENTPVIAFKALVLPVTSTEVTDQVPEKVFTFKKQKTKW